MKSIQSKTNCKLDIGSKSSQYSIYDYHYDDIKKLNSIPSNVSNIYISTDDGTEYLHTLISASQSVTMLVGCRTFKYGLPVPLRYLQLDYNFDEPLLYLEDDSNQEIPPGVLPDLLRTITLYSYPYEIPQGVLPKSLHTINLYSYQYDILPGALPNGLRKLSLYHYHNEIQLNLLPNSLRTINLYSYQHEIRPCVLPNGVLEFNLHSHEYDIRPGVLPDGLQKITIIKYKHEIQPGVLPSSLKILFVDEIFPETMRYHLEVLEFKKHIMPQIPSNIKIDKLKLTAELGKSVISLPSGVKSINFFMDLSNSKDKIIDFGGVVEITTAHIDHVH
ncbi:hypothetical protein PPL_00623 [Heterostelium album PN500]|uniref:FNIP repeat-containing protein n=1 Tax=Heterostelium pallidum (strain ATCC 26659 / Pp 5 / PN500) TaxID=670386 RepID=D3AWZ5_HETP5|nr:hypothetical protein PPL_00623 [Heterostelium album PN500]EFA86818.1 hypothetical protein PPL_00623 [Heterostelium album PN500]|eukprot:XP_020438921.1 hypothetical protein PPL_00623 [Heterostelium album PN500]